MTQVGLVQFQAEGHRGRQACGQPEGADGAVAIKAEQALLGGFHGLLSRGHLQPGG